MIVKEIIEHEDGSATVVFDMTADEIHQAISYAIKDWIMQGMKINED